MEKQPCGSQSPERRVLGLVNNNNIYSPTANLHLLTNVATELADSAQRARKKSSTRRSSDFKPRKDKSLGILCDKFLGMFPLTLEANTPSVEICLDKVSDELGIVKRRIYDIINILESLHMTSRVAKNRYKWLGNRYLKPVLSHLKRLAFQYGLDSKMQEIQTQQDSQQPKPTSGVPCFCDSALSEIRSSSSLPLDCENFFHDERTLGIMCQKFIMLFLVMEEAGVVNLDLATQMLVNATEKASFVQPTSSEKSRTCNCQPRHKTKVRRLYDIANVLTSLGLIRKERLYTTPLRKPVFVYSGPDVEVTENYVFDSSHTMRNSLLRVPICDDSNSLNNIMMRLSRKRKELDSLDGPAEKHSCPSSEESKEAPPPITRLGSLEDILLVAEQEFKLLLSEESLGALSTSSTDDVIKQECDVTQIKQESSTDEGILPEIKQEPSADEGILSDHNELAFSQMSHDSGIADVNELVVLPEENDRLVEQEIQIAGIDPPAGTDNSMEQTLKSTTETEIPTDHINLSAPEPSISVGPAVFTTAGANIPVRQGVFSAGTTLPVGPTVISIAGPTIPASQTVLTTAGNSFIGQAVLTFVGTTNIPLAQTVFTPLSPTNGAQTQSNLAIHGSTVTHPETSALKTAERSHQPTQIKVLTASEAAGKGQLTFASGPVSTVQSADGIAAGKLKKFTVTRKLVPSHIVLRRDPTNALKLTLRQSQDLKGIIQLRRVQPSQRLSLPLTCIKTLKPINIVKASSASVTALCRTNDGKKSICLVPITGTGIKDNTSIQ